MKKCLACLGALNNGEEIEYHAKCLKEFWLDDTPVLQLDYALSELEELARANIAQCVIVPGVQPKLSLGINQKEESARLTIVGALQGRYILKPPYLPYRKMPEIESLAMLMARACGIPTVPFLLIRLKGGELAYLTRRIDRDGKGNKFAMEDACQFTQKPTERKYKGSHEQIVREILRYNGRRLVDVIRFYEQVIVSYLIGNNDMHLKNFSLIAKNPGSYQLAPAYDLLAVRLLLPEDDEELALTLNGKRKRLKKKDFDSAMFKAGLPPKGVENLWKRVHKGTEAWGDLVDRSFLDPEQKEAMLELMNFNFSKIWG